MNNTEQSALSFLEDRTVGTLATVSAEGLPRARTVYYVSNELFEIFFFTLAGTRKVEDINANHLAAFVVSDGNLPQTLQLEGVLTELPDSSVADPQMQQLFDVLTARGSDFAPLAHLDASRVLFYKLTPTWVRFGDFVRKNSTDEVLTEIIS